MRLLAPCYNIHDGPQQFEACQAYLSKWGQER